MRWTIGLRLALGYAIVIALLLVVAGAALKGTKDLVTSAEQRQHSYIALHDLNALIQLLTDAETGQRGFVLTGNEAYLEPYRLALPHVTDTLNELAAETKDNEKQANSLKQLRVPVQGKLDELAVSIAVRRDKGFEAALRDVSSDRGKHLMDDVRRIADTFRDTEGALLRERRKQTEASTTEAFAFIYGGAGLALLLALVTSLFLSRGITVPVGKLIAGTERLGAGELDHRIQISGDDEIVDLARAFNRMAERRSVADVQLTKSAAERERVFAAIKQTVQRLASASQELLAGSTQQASGMQEQSAAVAETVTVVDEVAHTSSQAADRAKNVASSARRSEEASRAGRKSVDDVMTVIATAKAQSDEVAERIASLAEQTQAIGEIVALITDIAEQTNLLALNAAIEASRAGEHGRGFTVVATEIKSLADESKKATQRVRQILGDIQKTANTAVLSTEQGTRSMNIAARSATAAGDMIVTLDAVIAEVAEAAAQIAASAGQQATGLAQIHQAMRDISQVSAQNLAATHQAKTAAADLASMGDTLTSLIGTSGA